MSTAPPGTQFPPSPSQKSSIFDRSFCLSISRGWPGLTRAISREFIKVEGSDKSRFHATKDLYNSPIIKKMINNEVRLDMRLDQLCLPFPLKRGVRILPIDMFD